MRLARIARHGKSGAMGNAQSTAHGKKSTRKKKRGGGTGIGNPGHDHPGTEADEKDEEEKVKIIEAVFTMADGTEKRIDFIGWLDFGVYVEQMHGWYTAVSEKVREENDG